MDLLAARCSWADAHWVNDPVLNNLLPLSLRNTIVQSSGAEYLDSLADAFLHPGCTDALFVLYQPLVVELSARWLASNCDSSNIERDVSVLSTFARIYPLARYLKPRLRSIFGSSALKLHLAEDPTVNLSLDNEGHATLLLAIFRLLSADPEAFGDLVKPTFLSSYLTHDSRLVRLLAIQCISLLMCLADGLTETLVQKYVGSGPVIGTWEGRTINYCIFKLLEEKRWTRLNLELESNAALEGPRGSAPTFKVAEGDLSPTTSDVAGVHLPRDGPLQVIETAFVQTATASTNLSRVGRALLMQKPILLVGSANAGKTSLINEAARLLNQHKSLVTLHLNEQTDAKSLLGVHTSAAAGDAFVWKPGVLTKAVQEGRWVVIEDIDRAPSEVLGLLRPVIETGSLFLPNTKQHLRPTDGFRVFATIKTTVRPSTPGNKTYGWLFSSRLWSVIRAEDLDDSEIRQLIERRSPMLQPFLADLMNVHTQISHAYNEEPSFRASRSRLPNLRDLLKWCRRIEVRLGSEPQWQGDGMVSESLKIAILKDALDCYAAYHGAIDVYQQIAQRIARILNVSPQQLDHIIQTSDLRVSDVKAKIIVGRSELQKVLTRQSSSSARPSFAMTDLVKRNMDTIAATVSVSEPLLLVGETGVGKTTIVQHLASLVNQRLTVINLSQQSEAADLLGGLKPITTRSLIIPLADQFSTLFDDTFSNKRNAKFQIAIAKSLTKQNWVRLLMLWSEAIQMARTALNKPTESVPLKDEAQPVKRRKVSTKFGALRERWATFSAQVNQIRAQVERGDRTHTFAFVEGRLVQAVRNGEWLLLDEINLASADTLDHIVGLLHNGQDQLPSILLSEAGNIQHIVAHPNFRVFAAMNPATDTGKKDLAPGLRSRFTELYVHPGDKNVNDLTKIIESYLGTILANDKRAATDLAQAYLALQQLNAAHQVTDGAGDAPHFSTRSLVRCLLYVIQHHSTYGLRRAMCEGFAMSFFTVLSRESEQLVGAPINSHLLSTVRNPRAFLSQKPKSSFDSEQYVSFSHHLVRRGLNQPDLQPRYIRTPSVERNLINLARAASMRRFPILLQGPTSAGKTSMVEYLAKLSGNEFVRINNHEHTDLQEYLGSYVTDTDGKLVFREGVLVQALRLGHWIVLDELNLAPTDVLEALNRLLDDNRELLIPESQEIVRPHPNFMLFATQNPAGLYGGRKRLSRAFRNRFLEIHFDDIPENELEVILRERTQIAPSFCTHIVQVYKQLSLQRQSTRLFEQRNSFATLRDLFRWASRPVDDRQELARHGFMLLTERVRDQGERAVVKRVIETTLKVRIDEDILYGAAAIPMFPDSNSIVWTQAMRRLFVLVSEALKNNEPVLLVGETGCGKTQICQTVAQAFGQHLSIYNAHANTETGDLIGSQRPIRQRSDLAKSLLNNLRSIQPMHSSPQAIEDQSIDELIDQFNQLDTSRLDPDLVAETRRSISAYQSLFIWNDGSLVRSMKNGEHFLLDEISLADDSVLERLNSVLEPSRTILLAEKGPDHNLVVANPSFQFLATMNPGGDYGKRELSAALRNRLTEIWVPALSEKNDILPILESRLGPKQKILASAMLDFALWFKQSMQNSATSTIPLRSLLTWSSFIKNNALLGPELAFLHGAAMVYVDSLGANPAGLSSPVQDIISARKLCHQKLQSLLPEVDVASLYNEVPTRILTPDQVRFEPFSLNRSANPMPHTLVFDTPTTLKNSMRIVRALQMDRPILLEGSPGVGKTAIVTAIAALIGKPLTRINLSDQTDLMDLFGTDAPAFDEALGHFLWKDGPLLKAMQSGGWVLLDEMNLASQSVLEGLNSCLDHRQEVYIAELDKSFKCHPDFTLFAAQNPHHQGGGRKGLPASFVNRFNVVYADPFTQVDLLHICRVTQRSVSLDRLETIIDTIVKAQALVNTMPGLAAGGPWELNLRDVNRWVNLCEETPFLSPEQHFDTVVGHRFRGSSYQKLLKSECFDERPSLSQPSLYRNLSPNSFQLGTTFLRRDKMLQRAGSAGQIPTHRLPQAKSIITAINHAWPVLLVGGSGTGKSSLIRSLAALAGANLVELSINADIDALDLIGGFEQYDPSQDVLVLQTALRARLLSMVSDSARDSEHHDVWLQLVRAYEQCSSSKISIAGLILLVKGLAGHMPEFQDFEQQLQLLLQQSENPVLKFTWNDGILIDAVRNGSWLVLDNANLCNPAVLDRLNSLLEPNGQLVLDERHNSEGDEKTLTPHPNFRIFLTMDPRYGELSRAMRNRSLEVFLESLHESNNPDLPQYFTTASISRLRSLCTNVGEPGQSLDPYLEAMSQEDRDIVQSQILHLLDRPIDSENKLQLAAWSGISKSTLGKTREFYSRLLSSSSKLSAVIEMQDQAPLPVINEPLLDLTGFPEASAIATTRIILQQLQHERIQQRILQAAKNSETKRTDQMTCLEHSVKFLHRDMRKSQSHSHIPAYQFLRRVCSVFTDVPEPSSDDDISYRQKLIWLIHELTAFFDDSQPDASILHAFLELMRGQLSNATFFQASVGKVLSKALDLFGSHHELTNGRGLHRMWPHWKPLTASNLHQLEALGQLESLLIEFDQLAIRLPLRLTELAAVRSKLIDTHTNILMTPHAIASIGPIQTLVRDLIGRCREGPIQSGILSPQFHWLEKNLLVQKAFSTDTEYQIIALLAQSHTKRPTSDMEPAGMQALRILSTLNAVNDGSSYDLDVFSSEKAAIRTSQALSNITKKPLCMMSYAQQEIDVFASAICKHVSEIERGIDPALSRLTTSLVQNMLECFPDVLSDTTRQQLSLSTRLREITNLPFDSIFLNNTPESVYLVPTFEPIWDRGSIPEHVGSWALYETGRDLVQVLVAFLKLFVPDQIFDPSVYYVLVRDQHQHRLNELRRQIGSHQNFQRQMTGQDTSMLIRMFEADLQGLVEPTSIRATYRPASSELSVLQGVFSNIPRAILHSRNLTDALSGNPSISVASSLLLRGTIKTLIGRLSQVNRAYNDLTQPVLWSLNSLCLGLKMMEAACAQEKHDGNSPLRLLGPQTMSLVSSMDDSHPPIPSNKSRRELLRRIEQLQLGQDIDGNTKTSQALAMHEYLVIANRFYNEWKQKLTKQQANAEAQSRYYAYRGEDEHEEEDNEMELSIMFPLFDNDNDSETSNDNREYDPRATAIQLAALHSRLLTRSSAESQLRKYVLELTKWHDSQQGGQTLGPDFVAQLPGILLQLKDSISGLSESERNSAINIYTDYDIVESRHLTKLVGQIQDRFAQIQSQWPEHAVPVEVQDFSNEILAFKIDEPVAKLLTKTEKLLQIVGQWQSVASREWSVTDLMEALTNTIIHWRRMELSSWSRLLNLEDRKVKEDAGAWYFIAYEAVVYNSLGLVEQSGNVQDYCIALVKTLEEFLQSTSLGQYSSRMKLLETLAQTLKVISTTNSALRAIVACLNSVLSHYRRFTTNIEASISKGRAELEKQVNEQIKLASWKDTNIQSLRDSARRSHNKLFRIVKKYRTLLSQPLGSLKADGIDSAEISTPAGLLETVISTVHVEAAARICEERISEWHSRPERLRDPLGASRSMQMLFTTHKLEFDVPGELSSFRRGLASSAQELRKETPQTLNEQNSALARHLRGRKRRLMADTMKNLSAMGIRRNLATRELGLQASTSLVLARTSDIQSFPFEAFSIIANNNFHNMLDTMPAVRSALREHSDDLTDGEILRAAGLLEGLLSHLITQRVTAVKVSQDLHGLTDKLELLKNVQTVQTDQISQSNRVLVSRNDWLQTRARWVPKIIGLTCEILSFQSKSAEVDMNSMLSELQGSRSRVEELAQQIHGLPELPPALLSREAQDVFDECESCFSELATKLEVLEQNHPSTGYLLSQLKEWLSPFKEVHSVNNGAIHADVQNIDDKCRNILNRIFVALQRIAQVQPSFPTSSEDTSWLVKSDNILADTFRTIHLDDLVASIDELFLQLQQVLAKDLDVVISLLVLATPILDQYSLIVRCLYESQLSIHSETCRLGVLLSKLFVSLANEGFCSPSDPSNGQDQQSGKLESGTGLGEGEGAEDISKEIGDDEDLSELAQAANEEREDDREMDKSRDAVDMGADDLEGQMGSDNEKGSDEESDGAGSDAESDNMDEETGSVDELDPSAVDEKMWDDMRAEAEKDDKGLKSEKSKGQETDEQTAKDERAPESGEEKEEDANGDADDDDGENADDEVLSQDDNEGDVQGQEENLDPHLDEEQALDLPDDMQIDGDEGKDEGVSNDGMDDLSDLEAPEEPAQRDEVDHLSEHETEEQQTLDGQEEADDMEMEDEQQEGKPDDHDIMEDQAEDGEEDNLDTRDNETNYDIDDTEGGEAGLANQKQDQLPDDQKDQAQGQNDADDVVNEQQTQTGKGADREQTGDTASGATEHGAGQDNEVQRAQLDALKKLADILDNFHQRREILTASEDRKQAELDAEANLEDADFEHLQTEEDQGDAQALGSAAQDQAQNVDQSKAIEERNASADEDLPMPDSVDSTEQDHHEETIAERFQRLQAQPKDRPEEQTNITNTDAAINRQQPTSFAEGQPMDKNIDEETLAMRGPAGRAVTPPTSASDAIELWSTCSTRTHSLSLLLTEQLRLILAPTTATKLRGDFRTGKRLNIKRIIPYIASGYKRDKIWMRRSVPSKRNYQIMIAVDDSKSMSEFGADILAFETVAMLCKSLSMLESGELSVVVFGEEEHIRVAHPFGQPFTSAESGAEVFRHFSFKQKGTDVRKLIRESIPVFQDARLRSPGAASDDLWQLQLIVSDGHCSDHESIRRLVLAAQQQKIVIVFVIVDAGQDSIVDLKEAVFERVDPADENSEMTVKTKRYLEGFPFQYYVVVRDVGDLPGVLARVLKGWFESVVDVQ